MYKNKKDDIFYLYLDDVNRCYRNFQAQHISMSTASKENLILSCLRLPILLSSYYVRNKVERLDLIQAGNAGLVAAAHAFNRKAGTKFSTYAYYWINAYMKRCVSQTASLMTVSEAVQADITRVSHAAQVFQQKFNHYPTPRELSEDVELDMTPEKIDMLMDLNATLDVVSLDRLTTVSGNSGMDFIVDIMGEEDLAVKNDIDTEEAISLLQNSIKELDYRAQYIIKSKYGLEDYPKISGAEIGKNLRISRQRENILEKRAINELKNYMLPKFSYCLKGD